VPQVFRQELIDHFANRGKGLLAGSLAGHGRADLVADLAVDVDDSGGDFRAADIHTYEDGL
jgi:hypothetical protein